MDFIIANKRDIIGKISFDSVPGAMIWQEGRQVMIPMGIVQITII